MDEVHWMMDDLKYFGSFGYIRKIHWVIVQNLCTEEMLWFASSRTDLPTRESKSGALTIGPDGHFKHLEGST